METTPPGTPRRDDAQHDAPPQDRPGAETPPQYRGLRGVPFAPQRSRSRSSSEESGLRVAVLPGPVDEGDIGGGDGGGDGGGGDGIDGGGNERARRRKTIGVALFFLVNAASFLAAWQYYTRLSHEVLELEDDGIDIVPQKIDVLENDATDHLWPLKPEWVGVGVGTSTDIIVGSITGLDELAGGSELTQQCDRCKKGDIKRPSGLDSKSYKMPDSGVAKMMQLTGPEAPRGPILSKYLAALAEAFNTLQENCHITNPFSPMMKYIKRDQTKMDSVDYAVLYHCNESKSMSAKGGRVTKSRAAAKDLYPGEDCVNVMVLDRMLETDLAPLKDVYRKFPNKYRSMKPGDYNTITIKEALKKQKKSGVSFLYTDVFLPMVNGCKEDCPWEGGNELRGLQKGHHLNSGESGMQEALGITGGAMHEMLRALGNMQWTDDGLDEINADIHNLFVPRLRQFQRGFTGDERSPDSFEESTFDPATSGQSWATTYASGDSIFSNAELFVAPVDEPDIAADEPDQQSYEEEEEEKEGGDGAPASIHTKLHEATTTLCDYVFGVTDSASKRFHNGWRIWVDLFEKKADVNSAHEEYSAADCKTSLSNVKKLLNAFTKTVGDPFKTFRIMNLNENKLTFEGKDYDMATLLTEEYGYRLLHTYRYVRVYWLENDDCQISLIFLHKPWHIAFQSYPLFGKGSRGPYSRQELAIMANIALTIEWQRTVWQGLVNGNIQRAEATQTAFGSVPSAFGLFVYCYRDAHLDPQVCAAIAKAAILVPRGVHPLLRKTMKTKHVTQRERDAARGIFSGEERDSLIRHTIQQCTTAPSAGPVDNAAKEVVVTMIDPEGKKRTKHAVDSMIANLGRDQFKPPFIKILQKEHNRQRKEMKSERDEADNKRKRKKEDAMAEAMARMKAKTTQQELRMVYKTAVAPQKQVLLWHGEKDSMISVLGAAYLEAAIPNAALTIISGGTHQGVMFFIPDDAMEALNTISRDVSVD